MSTRMMKVVNHNEGLTLKGRYDGEDFVFEPEKPTYITLDAAKHIFGLGTKDKSQALNMLGLLIPGGRTYQEALEFLDKISFLEGRTVYPTEAEAAAEASDEEGAEPGTAPQTQGPGGGRRSANRSKPGAANPA